jgi:hypothetical protein
MQITFPYQKKVRVLDSTSLPADVLEVIIRHGVMAMVNNPETKDIIKAHSTVRKPPQKPSVVAIG